MKILLRMLLKVYLKIASSWEISDAHVYKGKLFSSAKITRSPNCSWNIRNYHIYINGMYHWKYNWIPMQRGELRNTHYQTNLWHTSDITSDISLLENSNRAARIYIYIYKKKNVLTSKKGKKKKSRNISKSSNLFYTFVAFGESIRVFKIQRVGSWKLTCEALDPIFKFAPVSFLPFPPFPLESLLPRIVFLVSTSIIKWFDGFAKFEPLVSNRSSRLLLPVQRWLAQTKANEEKESAELEVYDTG